MTQVITNSMPLGVAGDITRSGDGLAVESQTMGATPLTSYGLPAKLVSGAITGIVAGDTAGLILGFLVRANPSQGGNAGNQSFGAGTPPLAGATVSLLKSGYIAVQNNAGTPAKEGAVYVRIANPSGAKVVGGIEAVADGVDTIQVANCVFTGAADATGVAEIRFNV